MPTHTCAASAHTYPHQLTHTLVNTSPFSPLLSKSALVKLLSHKVYPAKGSSEKNRNTEKELPNEKNSKTHPLKVFGTRAEWATEGRGRECGGDRNQRAGPRQVSEPHKHLFLPRGASGNLVSRPGLCPLHGHRQDPRSQRFQPHHLSKGLDNKRARAEKWGKGDSKSSKSYRGRGCVLLSPPPSF